MKKTKDPNNRIPNETIELYWRMGYKISIDLTLRERSFRNSSPKNFLILELLLPVSWIATKFTYIGIRSEDAIVLNCIEWEKIICNVCIYQPETDTLIGILGHTIALHAGPILSVYCAQLSHANICPFSSIFKFSKFLSKF